MKKYKLLFIRTDWNSNPKRSEEDGYGGVGYYRIVKPAQKLLKKFSDKYEIIVVGKDFNKFGKTPEDILNTIFSKFDLIFTKNFDNEFMQVGFAFFSEKYKVPVIIDLDDNYLKLRDDNPAYIYYDDDKKSKLGAFLSLISGISVSTQPLKDFYFNRIKEIHNIEKEIIVLPNCNDVKDFNFKNKKSEKNKIVIAYQGSTTHYKDLEIVFPVLNELLLKYDNLFFEIIGAFEKDKWDFVKNKFDEKVRERIIFRFGTYSFKYYPGYLMGLGFDIGIAPLINDEFNICKSHIKWLEYSMKKIPTVASNVYPYKEKIYNVDVIKDGETGFLCNTQDDWFDKLDYLIKNKEERKRIGYNAYNYIKKNWQWENFIDKWDDFFEKIIKKYR